MKVPYTEFGQMHREIRMQMNAAISAVMDKNCFIDGEFCADFEKVFADYLGATYCVGCGNGLDALHLILRSYDIGAGDEVIVPAHTFIATALAVSYVGATPIFVDVEPDWYCLDPKNLEAAITPRTKAVMMVDIYGQAGAFDEVRDIARRHGLYLIEDAAQAHGATYKNRQLGTLGDAAGFSFYPGKNLGALGDGGCIVTNDFSTADKARALGNYGSRKKYQHEYKGINSRLDSLQAAILGVKLQSLDKWVSERRRIANRYLCEIANPFMKLPAVNPNGEHAWHIFAVMAEERERFLAHMRNSDIAVQIHYPVPMHLHEAYRDLGYCEGNFPVAEYIASHEVSLPMYYGMTEEQIGYVINTTNEFH